MTGHKLNIRLEKDCLLIRSGVWIEGCQAANSYKADEPASEPVNWAIPQAPIKVARIGA